MEASNGSHLSVKDCFLTSECLCVVEVQGTDTTVCFDGCTIEDGAHADDGGFSIYDGAQAVLRGNRISAHVHSAIEIQGEGTVADLMSNTVCGARYSGVVVREGARATLRGNNICGNSYDGIEVNHRGTEVKLANNHIHGGFRYGVRVSELASAHMNGNSIVGNDLTGVHIDFGSSVEMRGNSITRNGLANKSRHTDELERFSTHEQRAYRAGKGFPGVCVLRGSTVSFAGSGGASASASSVSVIAVGPLRSLKESASQHPCMSLRHFP